MQKLSAGGKMMRETLNSENKQRLFVRDGSYQQEDKWAV